MKLAEFFVKWSGNYTEEQIKAYEIMHGDNRETWPKTNDTTLITIDLDLTSRFNPGEDDNTTTVELSNGRAYAICMSYDEFKNILGYIGIQIINFTNSHALQNINKPV